MKVKQRLDSPVYLWNSLIYSAGSAIEAVDRRTSVGLNRNHKYVQCVFVVKSTKDLISSEACANGDEKEELTREKEGEAGGERSKVVRKRR